MTPNNEVLMQEVKAALRCQWMHTDARYRTNGETKPIDLRCGELIWLLWA